MKRLLPLVAVSLAVGFGLGAALGYYDARPWTFALPTEPPAVEPQTPVPVDPSDGPVAQVDEPIFNFDKMERGSIMRHEFEIKNSGTKSLDVTFVSHTCKCTAVELDGQPVEPGASTQVAPGDAAVVALEWQAKAPAGPFRHGGTFTTNDPVNSRVELVVEGAVVESTTLLPPVLHFEPIADGESGTAELTVMAFLEPEVVIESYEFDDPHMAERMTIDVEPVPQEDLADTPANAAVRVRATYRPDGMLGRFMGTLRLRTNLKKAAELAVPVYGLVRGDVTVYGQGWIERQGVLRMAPVVSSEGGVAKLSVNIRGDQARDAKLTIDRVEPAELQATLGEPRQMGDLLKRYPLEVAVPKGTRPMVRTGEDHGGEGLIVVKSTSGAATELTIRVHFTVIP